MNRRLLVSFIFGLVCMLVVLIPLACKPKYDVVVGEHRYRLVQRGYTDSEGRRFVPLYEREGDTNRWYTPSLTGNMMNPLAR